MDKILLASMAFAAIAALYLSYNRDLLLYVG